MNQIKIGKFIAERRKNKNLTQLQLAEKLNITDRAISKWETGKGMPDSSIMMELCKELDISVNELLSGELIDMNNYNSKLDENLIKLQRQKEYGITSARWSYIITSIILLIWNFINAMKYGVVESTDRPEFVFMLITQMVYWWIYIFLSEIKNHMEEKKSSIAERIKVFMISLMIIISIFRFFPYFINEIFM